MLRKAAPKAPRRKKPAEKKPAVLKEVVLDTGALQEAIFNSANFSSIATDAKGVIQIFNVGAERMLGYSADDVTNKITPADISDPQELIARASALSRELSTTIKPGFEALVFKAKRGIEDIYELTYIRKDGSRFPAVVSVTALRDANERVIGYLLIGTDNTARKQIEAEREKLDQRLRDKNAELETAREVAEKASLAKSEFLSSMSHELRSPLNAILGFAQLMDSEFPAPSPSQKSSISQILKAGWYLLKLVNEILDLAVVESGKLSLSVEPVSLAEVMIDCQAIITQQATKRGLRVTFPTFSTPHFVKADRVRLKQVLINLLSNAVKYNRQNGSIAVEVSNDGEVTRINVRDTGLGLSDEKVAQLFQTFNRLGRETTGVEGTGIGLVMSKLLVELMGGKIGVQTRVGTGSTFWFELSSAEAPHLTAEELAMPAAMTHHVRLLGPQRTLLYVEDNVANLELVAQIIARRPDLALLTATDGALGVQVARDNLPDLILMDINLPGLNGYQALRRLQKDPLTTHIPVIATSANAMAGDIERGLDAGFVRYLTKPINVADFMLAIDETLKAKELGPVKSSPEASLK